MDSYGQCCVALAGTDGSSRWWVTRVGGGGDDSGQWWVALAGGGGGGGGGGSLSLSLLSRSVTIAGRDRWADEPEAAEIRLITLVDQVTESVGKQRLVGRMIIGRPVTCLAAKDRHQLAERSERMERVAVAAVVSSCD